MSHPDESPLGKPTAYPERYDPVLLYPIPRAAQREALGIAAPLPFRGWDVWNAYELSWLDRQGKPVVAVGMFLVPADSVSIVESKSLKLYLNAFSQSAFADTGAVRVAIERDLSAAFGGEVRVELLDPRRAGLFRVAPLEGESLDSLALDVAAYSPDPGLLSAGDGSVDEVLVSDLLKSNCPVTGQPDWASIQIRYRGRRIDRAGLLRYVISYRGHAGFHESCVERMFVDILERCRPERLSVYARYTRRGGLDINPFRSNWETDPPPNVRTPRQ